MVHPRKVEVVFTPELLKYYDTDNANVVVIDILRATSGICAAIENGAREVIPVPDPEEARKWKNEGYLVAAERDGEVLDFADVGNSPLNFTPEKVKGKSLVYSTTNGARTIRMASHSRRVFAGSFANLHAIIHLLKKLADDVVLLCAGWKGKFCLEDTLCAGAIAEGLLENDTFHTTCDSAHASIDLWQKAKPDLFAYVQKAMQIDRLRSLKSDDSLEFCHTLDSSTKIPVFINNVLVEFRSHSSLS